MQNSLKIKDLPLPERPVERLLRYGTLALSNSELIAIILRTGTKDENVVNLSMKILKSAKGLNGLLKMSAKELQDLKGIGKVKSSQILALGEIIKRFNSFKSGDNYRISSPKDVFNLLNNEMKLLNKEHFKIIMLNVKNVVIKVKDVSIGSLNSSIVHPREVFFEAINEKSASIIICHNHPSGDPTPSREDINVTKRLLECGKILGIQVLDHIIIGNGIYISLKEKGIL